MKLISPPLLLLSGLLSPLASSLASSHCPKTSSVVGITRRYNHRRWNDSGPNGNAPVSITLEGSPPSRRRRARRMPLVRHHRCRHEYYSAFCSPPPSMALPPPRPLVDWRDDITVAAASSSSSSSSVPRIFPARTPLTSFLPDDDDDNDGRPSFSILSWNILLPNSKDNWWCHKQYAKNVDMSKRTWPHRRTLIRNRIAGAMADVVCLQEADGDTFHDDFDYMSDMGYDVVLHRKFRFRCATFYLRDKFVLVNEAHKDRTLVTSLVVRRGERGGGAGKGKGSARDANNDDDDARADLLQREDVLHIVNCHLSGGAAPERRLRQVNDGLEQIRKWMAAFERDLVARRQSKGRKRRSSDVDVVGETPSEHHHHLLRAGIVVCGDFNSDGNTAVRKLLVEGSVDPEWREPQYPNLTLTSRRLQHTFGQFDDAAELAYCGNVCDGDYSDVNPLAHGARPATYVVPNLASLLLMPLSGVGGGGGFPPRTEFGMQVARGLAETLNLNDFRQPELDRAFDLVDGDGNGRIDEDEVSTLLENVYVATYGREIEKERNNFFRGFGKNNSRGNNDGGDSGGGLTREQFIARLKTLQSDREGERKSFGLARGLNLRDMSDKEMERAFDQIDLDGNGLLDECEFQTLLENVYKTIYGEEIDRHRAEFFSGFRRTGVADVDAAPPEVCDLTREQFAERLLALHQELNGGRTGSELAEVRTEADVDIMIKRFTPLLVRALDGVFDMYSSNGLTLTQDEVNEFLIRTNGELGRGGTYRHTRSIFDRKATSSTGSNIPPGLTRYDWYGVFARELAEGKWWQVVYDLEVCGFDVRSHRPNNTENDIGHEFYQGWLDYIYFRKLRCVGVQDGLTEAERRRIYIDGDALPNEWHPSDHIPVGAVFSWI